MLLLLLLRLRLLLLLRRQFRGAALRSAAFASLLSAAQKALARYTVPGRYTVCIQAGSPSLMPCHTRYAPILEQRQRVMQPSELVRLHLGRQRAPDTRARTHIQL